MSREPSLWAWKFHIGAADVNYYDLLESCVYSHGVCTLSILPVPRTLDSNLMNV